MVSENLVAAIYYHATKCKERGDGGEPGDPTYGLLTELEHRNLTTLHQNIKAATTFLFKGIKDEAAVGGVNEDTLGVPIGTGPLGDPVGLPGSGAMDLA